MTGRDKAGIRARPGRLVRRRWRSGFRSAGLRYGEAIEILVVELWYDHQPVLDHVGLGEDVCRSYPDAESVSTNGKSPFLIGFPSLVHEFSDGVACLVVSVSGPGVRNDAGPPRDLTQTWSWPQAPSTWAGTTHTVLVADVMGRLWDCQTRRSTFVTCLRARWPHADQRWRVSHQSAGVDPERLVLDLDPGPEFGGTAVT